MKVTVDLVSDIICPWCYIAKARLERVEQQLQGEITVVKRVLPFLLYPHIPRGGAPKSDFSKFTRPGMGRGLREEAAAEDISIHYRKIERIPNSLEAHRLLYLARNSASQFDLAKRLFHAYFEEGANVEDPELLTACAGAADVPTDIIQQFLSSEDGVAEVDALIAEMKTEKFIRVVPTFILNEKHTIVGLQSAEVLDRYIRRAAARTS